MANKENWYLLMGTTTPPPLCVVDLLEAGLLDNLVNLTMAMIPSRLLYKTK
jgi:hypothetical protein